MMVAIAVVVHGSEEEKALGPSSSRVFSFPKGCGTGNDTDTLFYSHTSS